MTKLSWLIKRTTTSELAARASREVPSLVSNGTSAKISNSRGSV